MTPTIKKNVIFHSDLTHRFYYVSRYTDLGDGKIVAHNKKDITDSIESILKEKAGKLADRLEYCEHKMTNGDIWYSSAVRDIINELRGEKQK